MTERYKFTVHGIIEYHRSGRYNTSFYDSNGMAMGWAWRTTSPCDADLYISFPTADKWYRTHIEYSLGAQTNSTIVEGLF